MSMGTFTFFILYISRSSSLGAYISSESVFTGSEYPNASSSNWRSLSTELFTPLHFSTCQTGCSTSLICRRDVEAGCARRPPVYSTSARLGVSLSAIALLLLLAHDSGTVCPITHNISSETENSFILTIIPRHCSLTASIAIVVLEVIFS